MYIDKKMALRLSGYKGNFPPPQELSGLFDQCEALILKEVSPSYVSKIFPLKIDEDIIFIGSEKIKSKSLSKHLEGCSKVNITILTMGFEGDRLIKKLALTDISKSHMLSACLSAAAECFANELSEKLKEDMKSKKNAVTSRFSPGYGDLDINTQKILFSLTDCTKLTGIKLTDNFFMVPSKSISSITGIMAEK